MKVIRVALGVFVASVLIGATSSVAPIPASGEDPIITKSISGPVERFWVECPENCRRPTIGTDADPRALN